MQLHFSQHPDATTQLLGHMHIAVYQQLQITAQAVQPQTAALLGCAQGMSPQGITQGLPPPPDLFRDIALTQFEIRLYRLKPFQLNGDNMQAIIEVSQ